MLLRVRANWRAAGTGNGAADRGADATRGAGYQYGLAGEVAPLPRLPSVAMWWPARSCRDGRRRLALNWRDCKSMVQQQRGPMPALRPVTIITGASAGIGPELAKVFARNGHASFWWRGARTSSTRLPRISHERAAEAGCYHDDLGGCAPSRMSLAAELASRNLEAALIVNNAGFGLVGRAAELDRAEQLAMIDLNVRALTELSLAFVDFLDPPRAVFSTSLRLRASCRGPAWPSTTPPKPMCSRSARRCTGSSSQRACGWTVLCPGPVETEFQARAKMPLSYFPSLLKRSAARVAGGRL